MTVAEDVHSRLEREGAWSIDCCRERDGCWRVQLYAKDEGFGEGVGATVVEAIEGALDDLEANRG